MIDVIGKKLSIAKDILEKENYTVEVTEYFTDKQKEWDSLIVIRQKFKENVAELVVGNFKMEI